jgi:hypothetical protein
VLGRLLRDPERGRFEVSEFLDKPHHEVLPEIEQALSKAALNDLFLIYYSGHGKLDRNGRLCLATANTRQAALLATSIPARHLSDLVEHSYCEQVVLLLDCCYSGAVGVRGDVESELRVAESARGFYILTASSELQAAREEEEPTTGEEVMGRFTAALVGAIGTGAADLERKGEIFLSDLRRYLEQVVKGQTPKFFARNASGDPLISFSPATAMALLDGSPTLDGDLKAPPAQVILPGASLGEPVQQMANILNDFSVSAAGLITLRAESAPRYRDEYFERYGFVPETVARLKFEDAIRAYCKHVYDEHFWGGDGTLGDPPDTDWWSRPNFAGAATVPLLSRKMALGGISDLLSIVTLYFGTTVFVLPYEIRSQSLSYSGPIKGRTSWPALEKLLLLNKLHEAAVASGQIVFLPRKYVSEGEGMRDYSVISLESPGRQPAGEIRLLPLNPVHKAKRAKDAIRLPVHASIDVPFFPTLTPQDVAALPGLSLFRRFGQLLAEKLATTAAATSMAQFRQGLDSLGHASTQLRAEAEVIRRRLPDRARSELATMRIEITALTESEASLLGEPLGVLASPNLGIVLQGQGGAAVRQPEPGTLYFAILLQKPARKRDFPRWAPAGTSPPPPIGSKRSSSDPR